MSKHGNIGICQCRHCNAVNVWRSDLLYTIGDYIMPGFTGRCNSCSKQDWQTVLQLTETIEQAKALAGV